MSQRENPDWFPFYPLHFIGNLNVQAMTYEQMGAYVWLLCVEWVNGSIPADIGALARILKRTTAEMEILWQGIAPCFTPDPDDPSRMINTRLEEEREIASKRIQGYRKGGAKSASRKSIKEASSNQAEANLQPSLNQAETKHQPAYNQAEAQLEPSTDRAPNQVPSQALCTVLSLSNNKNNTYTDGFDHLVGFEQLWKAYPPKGRVRRPLSEQYYLEEVRSKETHEEIMAAVKGKWARSEKWAKGFIMSLPEWIHNRCWEEEPEQVGESIPPQKPTRLWVEPKPYQPEVQ